MSDTWIHGPSRLSISLCFQCVRMFLGPKFLKRTLFGDATPEAAGIAQHTKIALRPSAMVTARMADNYLDPMRMYSIVWYSIEWYSIVQYSIV